LLLAADQVSTKPAQNSSELFLFLGQSHASCWFT
jgi:hypothetical protein